jgi:hypothetical protein
MNFIYTFYKSSGEIVENVNVSEEVFNNIISETQYEYIEGSYNNENYYIDNGTPVLKPPRPDITYIFDYNSKIWIESPEIAGSIVRDTRNSLLADADILIFKAEDLGQDTTTLRQYRQALRDITKQQGFPLNVTFPTIPQ